MQKNRYKSIIFFFEKRGSLKIALFKVFFHKKMFWKSFEKWANLILSLYFWGKRFTTDCKWFNCLKHININVFIIIICIRTCHEVLELRFSTVILYSVLRPGGLPLR